MKIWDNLKELCGMVALPKGSNEKITPLIPKLRKIRSDKGTKRSNAIKLNIKNGQRKRYGLPLRKRYTKVAITK